MSQGAQPRYGNGFSGRSEHNGVITSTEVIQTSASRVKAGLERDPTSDLYLGNEAMFFSAHGMLLTVHQVLSSYLFSQGFVFKIQGKWRKTLRSFESIIDSDYAQFAYEQLRTLIVEGMFIWHTYQLPKGVMVPMTPDACQFRIEYGYDNDKNVRSIRPLWTNGSNESLTLYGEYKGLYFQPAIGLYRSMADYVKEMVRQFDQMMRSKIYQVHRSAHPALLVQANTRNPNSISKDDQAPPPSYASDLGMSYDKERDKDQLYREKITTAKQLAVSGMNQLGKNVASHIRTQFEIELPIEANFVSIPPGLESANYTAPQELHDVAELQRQLRARIFQIFCVPHNLAPKTNDKMMDKEIEVPMELFKLTLRKLRRDFRRLLTNTFKICHKKPVFIGEVHRTFSEEKKREISAGEVMTEADMFEYTKVSSDDVEVYLVSDAVEDEDDAQELRKLGIISSTVLYEAHPHLLEQDKEEKMQKKNDGAEEKKRKSDSEMSATTHSRAMEMAELLHQQAIEMEKLRQKGNLAVADKKQKTST